MYLIKLTVKKIILSNGKSNDLKCTFIIHCIQVTVVSCYKLMKYRCYSSQNRIELDFIFTTCNLLKQWKKI